MLNTSLSGPLLSEPTVVKNHLLLGERMDFFEKFTGPNYLLKMISMLQS
jgi:hypothetical protein